MEEALRALLLADTAVAALVDTRITWSVRPQGKTLPAVVLWLINDRQEYTMAGPDGVRDGTVQVDCWAVTYADAKGVARAVRAALSGYSGGIFQGVFVEAERDSFDDDQPKPFFRTSLDLRCWHNQAA